MVAQVVQLDVNAVVDVPQEPDLRFLQHSVQRADDALDARVVGGHAVADQAVGRWHPVQQVDLDRGLGLGQDVGGVHAGRSGPDDRDSQRAGHALSSCAPHSRTRLAPRSIGPVLDLTGRVPGEMRGERLKLRHALPSIPPCGPVTILIRTHLAVHIQHVTNCVA